VSDIADANRAALLEQVRRTFGSTPIADAIDRRKQIVFVKAAPWQAAAAGIHQKGIDVERAQRAVEKLTAGQAPAADELEALEACIRFMRPAWFIQDRRILLEDGPMRLDDAQRTRIERMLPGVASIGRPDQELGLATGFLIAPRVLVTNKHVVKCLTGGTFEFRPGQAVARFGMEYGVPDTSPRIPIEALIPIVTHLDIALFRLEQDGPLPSGLPLEKGSARPAGHRVVVVGYPMIDNRTPLFARAVYDDKYGVKRAAPGLVISADASLVTHDCCTLGGNSGSPVFDTETGHVIAIHAQGFFAYRNEAVPTEALWTSDVRAHVAQWV
jgi:V8-like Glu-specific endopeptidase